MCPYGIFSKFDISRMVYLLMGYFPHGTFFVWTFSHGIVFKWVFFSRPLDKKALQLIKLDLVIKCRDERKWPVKDAIRIITLSLPQLPKLLQSDLMRTAGCLNWKRVHEKGRPVTTNPRGHKTQLLSSKESSGEAQPRPSRTRDLPQGRQITARYLRERCQRVTNGSRHAMETWVNIYYIESVFVIRPNVPASLFERIILPFLSYRNGNNLSIIRKSEQNCFPRRRQ